MRAMKVVCGTAVALGISLACAEEFSWQVAGSHQDMNAASTSESSASSVRATWYVSAVDDQVGPYELAPFLNRSSYVTVGTSRSKHRERLFGAIGFDWPTGISPRPLPDDRVIDDRVIDDRVIPEDFGPVVAPFGPIIPAESGIDTREYAVQGRYVWPGSGWYVGANARRSDADILPDIFFGQTTMDQDSAGLFAGKYFGTRTTLELGLRSESVNEELSASPVIAGPGVPYLIPDLVPISPQTGVETETEDAELSVRHVGELGNSTFSLSASIQSRRTETRVFATDPTDILADILVELDPFEPHGPDFISDGDLAFTSVEAGGSERASRVSVSGALFPTRDLGVRLALSTLDHDTYGVSDLVGLSANWFFLRNAAVEVALVRTASGRGNRVGPTNTDSVAVRLLGRF